MDRNPPTVPAQMKVSELSDLIANGHPDLSHRQGTLIADEDGNLAGIITRGDLLRAIEKNPNGGTVLPNGTAEIVASEYPEKGNNTKITGPINIVAFRTTNGGGSWQRAVVDTLNTGATFATSSVTTVASDAAGTLVLLYSGSTSVGANGKVYVRRSTDSGATWSARAEMTTSAGGADGTQVAAAGKAAGQFVITWMDNRGGAFNVWERQSADGGVTWTADVKVSDATSGASYKTAAGFGTSFAASLDLS